MVELAESGGVPQRIFSTAEFFGSPLLSSPLNSWHLARVDLSAWAGRSVRIRLRAESPPDPSRLGWWSVFGERLGFGSRCLSRLLKNGVLSRRASPQRGSVCSGNHTGRGGDLPPS